MVLKVLNILKMNPGVLKFLKCNLEKWYDILISDQSIKKHAIN